MKTLRFLGELVLASAMILAVSVSFFSLRPAPEQTTAPVQEKLTTAGANEDLEKLIPEGSNLSLSQFRKLAGDDLSDLLTPLSPKSIRRDGTRFSLTCASTSVKAPGVTVFVDTNVACDASRKGQTITLENIDGIEVHIDYLGTRLPLKEAVITPTGGNRARVDARVQVSRWLPWIPVSIDVDMGTVK